MYTYMEKCKNPSCINEVKTKANKYCSRSCSASHRFTGNSFNKGKQHTEESKQKISESTKGSKRSEETKNKMRIAATGKKHSAERVEKHSKRMVGNKYGVGKKSFLGKTHSEEFKKNLSERMKGNTYSKGSKRSEETREKMRISASKRKFTGSSLNNYFIVEGIVCQGKSEKKYIEQLVENNSKLPTKCTNFIDTPYGKRQLDFEYEDKFIEIKSPWTIKFYHNSDQKVKDKWISQHIKKVEVIVI